jgi:hypothetical protein
VNVSPARTSLSQYGAVTGTPISDTAAAEVRQLKSFKIKGKPVDHQDCHLEARRHLRKRIWDDVLLSGAAALKRSEQLVVARQRDCDRLEQQMEKAKRELSIAEVAVRALRQFNVA